MKRRIKLYFSDFWPSFNVYDNYFTNLLSNDFDIEIDPKNPEFLFYSNFGVDYHKYNCVRIYFTGENVRPDFSECDWSFSFDYSDDKRNYRLPLYGLFADMNELTKPRDAEKILSEKSKFTVFIYSNPGPKKRVDFLKKLSEYKRIDSAGRYLNNIGGPIGGFEKEKREFIKKYKFTFAFENSMHVGYTTEKILDPLLSGSIPLYWGNPEVNKDFNSKCFLNYHDYGSEEEFINRIIEVDNNDLLYKEIIAEPPFLNNQINEHVKFQNVLNRLKYIFSQNIVPISEKSKYFSNNVLVSNYWAAKVKMDYQKKLLLKKIALFSFDRMIVKAHRLKENIFKS